MNRITRFLLLALGIVVLDQVVKLIVKFNMRLHQEIQVFGDWFKLYYIENKGAAFGLTIDQLTGDGVVDETTAKLMLTLFSLAAVAFIGWYLLHTAQERTGLPIFLSLILGGAIGNIIDRVFYGYWFEAINHYEGGLLYGRVVDLFYVDMGTLVIPDWIPLLGGVHYPMWPVFNVADSAISIGIVAIFLFHRRFFPDPKRHTAGQAEAAADASASPTSASPSGAAASTAPDATGQDEAARPTPSPEASPAAEQPGASRQTDSANS